MILFHSFETPTAHLILEGLAYFVGARIYWHQARSAPAPKNWFDRLFLLGCVVFMAALGSKAVHALEHFDYLLEQNDLALWLGGKSVLGGFLGGSLGAELGKLIIGWRRPTGDSWLWALAVGLAIGRMGCQMSGTWDQTYGIPTEGGWGWDHGDGVARHPVAAYEAIVMLGLAFVLSGRWRNAPGARFAAFMLGYCVFRFAIEFLKPPHGGAAFATQTLPVELHAGLSAIQWTAAAGCVYFVLLWRRRMKGSNSVR